MGASSSIDLKKSIYLTYDHNCKNYKVLEFTSSLTRLCKNVIVNSPDQINDCDIVIHLISQSTVKHHKQLLEIDKSINKNSILIYIDRKVPLVGNNTINNNSKTICISYLDYENFEQISPIIINKLFNE